MKTINKVRNINAIGRTFLESHESLTMSASHLLVISIISCSSILSRAKAVSLSCGVIVLLPLIALLNSFNWSIPVIFAAASNTSGATSFNFLKKFIKSSYLGLDGNISLSLDNEIPIKLTSKLSDKSEIKFYIAPKMD